MKYSLIVFSALATLLCAGCLEKTAPGDVPGAFFYKGKPVDPFCFMENTAQVGGGTVSLDVCTGKTKSAPAYNDEHFYGVSLDDISGGAYIYYKYLGEQGDSHVLQIVSSSGGVTQNSEVRVVSLDGNLLHTDRVVANGDRCNGGIDHASVSGNTISYSQNITPYDLVNPTNGNGAGFGPSEILSGATNCVGTADHEGDDLKTITLTQDPKDVVSEDLGPKDACFYGTYNETYKAGPTLDAERIKKFGETFNSRCAQLK